MYIDTEGTFRPERLLAVAERSVKRNPALLLVHSTKRMKSGHPQTEFSITSADRQSMESVCPLHSREVDFIQPFTSNSAKFKIHKLSKITTWVTMKKKQHQSNILLNSFPTNGHT